MKIKLPDKKEGSDMNCREPLGRRFTKEILGYVSRLCRENGLSYTLLFGALLSQEESEGFSDWLKGISIAMFFEDYRKLLQIIHDRPQDGYYAVSHETDRSVGDLYAQILKPGNVKLPAGREADQRYYDYFINVYPIFYAGNTRREFRNMYRKGTCYLRCLSARKPVPYGCTHRNLFRRLKMSYYDKKKKSDPGLMEDCFRYLSRYGNRATRYVYLPVLHRQRGIVRLAQTYRDVGTYSFEDIKITCINQKQDWLSFYYAQKGKKKMTAAPANRAILEGPDILRRVQLVSLEILIEFDRICRKHQIHYILAAGTLLGAVRHKGFIPWDDDIDIFILYEEWEKFEKVASLEIDSDRFFIRTQKTDLDDNLVLYQIKRNGTVYAKAGRDKFDTHRGIALDILPFYNSPKTWPVYWLQNRLCRFFKTMTWAHMGAESERKPLLRAYYRLLSRVSNKKSWQLYMKFANMIKKPGKYLVYLCLFRNPFHKGFNQRKFFENTIELEFENHFFPAPADYKEFLSYLYSEDYMQLPVTGQQINHHMPAVIDAGPLFSCSGGNLNERSNQ